MICKYCEKPAVKNGFDRKRNQRYKCHVCKKTFTSIRLPDELIKRQNMRMLIHLIIHGFALSELTKCTGIPEKKIRRYRGIYLKRWQEFICPAVNKKSRVISEFRSYARTEEMLLPGRAFAKQRKPWTPRPKKIDINVTEIITPEIANEVIANRYKPWPQRITYNRIKKLFDRSKKQR